ncbi:MAG: Gfo/Idh/MocA family oxidoreductase [Planctomycetes bacterium]|nr:Gfo/Idh/MocA family oxidoreductase [Planctomycetota bacterium]
MHQFTAAVAGAGFIGPVHVEGLRRAGVRVAGILGVSGEESRTAAAALGLERAYRSYDELLADRAVDAIHIAVPNRLHYDMARQALAAGKHVMCEKPLAMDSRESADLVALARRSGRAAAVNYNIRYYPLAIEARERVRRGDLGDIFHVAGSYVQDWLLLPTDYNWRVLAEEGGRLRAVADIGTHWLDLIHAVTGLEAEAVCADLRTVFPVRQRPRGEVETFSGKAAPPAATEPVSIATEDYGCVMLRFGGLPAGGQAGGARGCLWVSQVTAGRKNCLRYELAGSRAALAWCSERPNELWIGRRDRPNEVLLRDPALAAPAARAFIGYPGGHNEGFPDTFKQCFRAFYGSIAAGDFAAAPAFPTFADGHREIVLCEAILRSHEEGRWVQVERGAP